MKRINGIAVVNAFSTSLIKAGFNALSGLTCLKAIMLFRLRYSICGLSGSNPLGGRFRLSPCSFPK